MYGSWVGGIQSRRKAFTLGNLSNRPYLFICDLRLTSIGRSRFEAPDYDPPPLKVFEPKFYDDPDHRVFAFDLVLHALHGAERTLHHIDVAEVENDEVRRQVRREQLRPVHMLVRFDYLNPLELARAADTLKDLRSLHLSFFDFRTSLVHAASQGKMRKIISGMTSLESLELKFDGFPMVRSSTGLQDAAIIPLADILGTGTFSRLRNLRLERFWLEADELCEFLLRHSSTLQTLALDYIRLEATEQVERDDDGAGMESSEKQVPEESESDWYHVAKVCQQLPNLKGLHVVWDLRGACRDPADRLDWIGRMQEVMEIGMDGRPNIYWAAAAEAQEPIARMAREFLLEMAENAP